MDEGTLRSAADRIEIHELLNRYAHAIDRWDWDLLRSVFTSDVEVDFGSVDRYVEGDTLIRGVEALVAWYDEVLAPFRGVLHFMANHMVDLDGDRAVATCIMHVLHLPMGGLYEAECIRTPQGWRIHRFRLDEVSFEEPARRLTQHMARVDTDRD